MNLNQSFKTIFHSPIGEILIQANTIGLLSINFLDDVINDEFASNEITEKCKLQLEEYFANERKFFDLPLIFNGTEFQKRVWEKLQEIPFGETISYLSFSEMIGNKLQIRAVANANSKNPFPIVIPCHRVIGKDGNLVGYAGGLWRKKWLIDFEKSISGNTFNLELFSEYDHSKRN